MLIKEILNSYINILINIKSFTVLDFLSLDTIREKKSEQFIPLFANFYSLVADIEPDETMTHIIKHIDQIKEEFDKKANIFKYGNNKNNS